ncbi:MAG: DUF2160 domain-containing protein [Methyloligellaceae bacterium]
MDLSWMAWTWQTAAFFLFIAACLAAMSFWEFKSPGGAERKGILTLTTTRGDRLFISLLGSAFINLAWLAFMGPPLWIAVGICVVFAILVFLFV